MPKLPSDRRDKADDPFLGATPAVRAAAARLAGRKAVNAKPKPVSEREAKYRAQTGSDQLTAAQRRRAKKARNKASK